MKIFQIIFFFVLFFSYGSFAKTNFKRPVGFTNTLRNIGDMVFDQEYLKYPTFSSSPSNLGSQSTLILLVNFLDIPTESVTEEDVLFKMDEANQFYIENSAGKVYFKGVETPGSSADVWGWFKLPIYFPNDTEWYVEILEESIEAVDATVDFRNYQRLILVIEGLAGSFSGVGTVGPATIITNDGEVSLSVSWIESHSVMTSETVFAHELGHNLGAGHAGIIYDFQQEKGFPNNLRDLLNNFYTYEYADPFSIMGSRQFAIPHHNALHKELLGWLTTNEFRFLTSLDSGKIFELYPIESPEEGLKVLKILHRAESIPELPINADLIHAPEHYIYIEYRQPIGFDTNIDPNGYGAFDGAIIHMTDPLNRRESDLIYPRPFDINDPYDLRITLLPGQSVADPVSGVTITVIANNRDLTNPENSRLQVRVDY